MPELVKLARKNVSANNVATEKCAVHLYEWGGRMPAILRMPFDLILGSEVTALDGGHDSLLSTLRTCVEINLNAHREAPRVFLAETHRNQQQPKFWEKAEKSFKVSELHSAAQADAWNTLDKTEPVRIFELAPREDFAAVQASAEPVRLAPAVVQPVDSTETTMTAEVDFLEEYNEVFMHTEKLDAYGLSYDDMAVFKSHGYREDHVGQLGTYGSVLHNGVPLLFKAIADRVHSGCLQKAVEGKRFLDLGSAEARCVISAALHFSGRPAKVHAEREVIPRPCLESSVGIELSTLRHDLADKYRARIEDAAVKERVTLIHDDILSSNSAKLIREADIIYAANLRFPEEVNRRLGAHIASSLDPERDCFVLDLAPLVYEGRPPSDSWEVLVPMSWNPGGWPVRFNHFRRTQAADV
eukprot:TRINITY_DN19711_c0_g1_i2.p1 TRINITY_DN19711_c0_g1~~TRINITY_DN19711_c0_g1_i2.p1  ORF type:complete len:413 (-),score=102.24 TRINITY_DN19711_c0_g1_i2:11-1249(-)